MSGVGETYLSPSLLGPQTTPAMGVETDQS